MNIMISVSKVQFALENVNKKLWKHLSVLGRCFLYAKKQEVLLLYPVSEAFLSAVQENIRRYYWTGKITTKAGVVHEFSEKDIVKGSGYISSQCCGSTERELGTVYAAEMGIYETSEANRTIRCLEIKAYDYMLRFEKDFNITAISVTFLCHN